MAILGRKEWYEKVARENKWDEVSNLFLGLEEESRKGIMRIIGRNKNGETRKKASNENVGRKNKWNVLKNRCENE